MPLWWISPCLSGASFPGGGNAPLAGDLNHRGDENFYREYSIVFFLCVFRVSVVDISRVSVVDEPKGTAEEAEAGWKRGGGRGNVGGRLTAK